MPRRVMVDVDPITEEPFDSPRPYYIVRFGTEDNFYRYLVPAGEDGNPPTEEEVAKAINEYARHPSELGSRRIEHYISEETLDI